MKSIIYICPTGSNKPVGGIKIIYRHVEILSKLLPKKVDSKIFHFEDLNYRCGWFTHNVNFKKNLSFDSNIAQDISLLSMSRNMFLIVTVPVILGMLLRRFVSGAALKFEPIARKISIALFVLVLLGAIAAERENVISYFAQAGLITLALNVVMMLVAYFVAQLLASGTRQKKCITIECGLQNGTLAIFVATSIFGGGIYVIPAATYSLIMFATSLIFVYLVRKTV